MTFPRCIVCNEPTEAIDDHCPNDALIFSSHGNYGSRVWDAAFSDASYLRVIICDKCVKQRAASVEVRIRRSEIQDTLKHTLAHERWGTKTN